MATHSLHLLPGVGRDPEVAKRAALGGLEDEGLTPLDASRVQQLAEAITRAHPKVGSIRGEEADVSEAFFELSWMGEENGPDVFVSAEGVHVVLLGDGTEDENAKEVDRGLAIARTASSFLPGASWFEPATGRFVDPERDRDAVLAAARESFKKPSESAGLGYTPPRAAVRRLQRIMLLPLAGFLIAASMHRVTKWALLALPGGLVAAVVIAKRTLRSAKEAADEESAGWTAPPPGTPPPSGPPGGFGPGPISPG